MERRACPVLALLLSLAVSTRAADRPLAQAAPMSGPIRVDGRLDEPAWAGAPPIAGFRLSTRMRVITLNSCPNSGTRRFDRTDAILRDQPISPTPVLSLRRVAGLGA